MVLMWLIQHHIMKEFPKLKALHCKWGPQGKCGPLQSNTSEGVQNIGWILLWRRILTLTHPRTMEPNEVFFHWNAELLGLGRQIEQINSGTFEVFSAELSAPILIQWVTCSCFSLFHHYFYKKTKPLYPHPKYLFLILIWIWATKN